MYEMEMSRKCHAPVRQLAILARRRRALLDDRQLRAQTLNHAAARTAAPVARSAEQVPSPSTAAHRTDRRHVGRVHQIDEPAAAAAAAGTVDAAAAAASVAAAQSALELPNLRRGRLALLRLRKQKRGRRKKEVCRRPPPHGWRQRGSQRGGLLLQLGAAACRRGPRRLTPGWREGSPPACSSSRAPDQ